MHNAYSLELAMEASGAWLDGLVEPQLSEARQLLIDLTGDGEDQVAEREGEEAAALRAELRQELLQMAEGKEPAERLALLRMTGLERRINLLGEQTFALAKSIVDGERTRAAAAAEGRALVDACSALGSELMALGAVANHLERPLVDATFEAIFVENEAVMSQRLEAYRTLRGA